MSLREKLDAEVEPYVMTEMTGREELRPIAEEAGKRLRAALDSLTSPVTTAG